MKNSRSVRNRANNRGGAGERKKSPWPAAAVLLILGGILLAGGPDPGGLQQAGARIVRVLDRSVDLRGLFEQVGDRTGGARGTVKGLEEFCVQVFGPQPEQTQQEILPAAPQFPTPYPGLLEEETFFAELRTDIPEDTPEVGAVIKTGVTGDMAMPEGCTADMLSLGTLEYTAPVMGQMTSPFGYRVHPIDGTYSFHGGVDICAQAGEPVVCFADGTAEYIGEDDSYGLYLQVDHKNGIKSFYAHCQSVCVKPGQALKAGETVALVGSSGTATGPHLHLELKCAGLKIDPGHYLTWEQD